MSVTLAFTADGGRDIVVTEGAINFRGPVDQARVREVVPQSPLATVAI